MLNKILSESESDDSLLFSSIRSILKKSEESTKLSMNKMMFGATMDITGSGKRQSTAFVNSSEFLIVRTFATSGINQGTNQTARTYL